MFWELLCYQPPFHWLAKHPQPMIMEAVLEGDQRPGIPVSTPASFAALLQSGWHTCPDHRPTIGEILALLEKMMEGMRAVKLR